MPTRFDSMNRDELRAACRAAGMTGYSRLTLGEMRARLWDLEPVECALVRPERGTEAYESFAIVVAPDFAALEAAQTLVHRFTAQQRSNLSLRLDGGLVRVLVDNVQVFQTSVSEWAWLEERVVTTMGGERLEATPITARHICENTLQLGGPDSDTRHRDVQDEPRTRHRGRKRRVPSHLRTPARRARFEQRELERQARAAQQGEYSGISGQ